VPVGQQEEHLQVPGRRRRKHQGLEWPLSTGAQGQWQWQWCRLLQLKADTVNPQARYRRDVEGRRGIE